MTVGDADWTVGIAVGGNAALGFTGTGAAASPAGFTLSGAGCTVG